MAQQLRGLAVLGEDQVQFPAPTLRSSQLPATPGSGVLTPSVFQRCCAPVHVHTHIHKIKKTKTRYTWKQGILMWQRHTEKENYSNI